MICKYKDFYPEIDPESFVADGAVIVGNVRLGKNSSVWFNSVLRGDYGQVIVGENSNIQDGSVLHCSKNNPTIVGNNVTVGHGAILHSCTIGDNCLIGMGAIVLDKVVIGQNCLIGAGSLVTPNTVIPDGSLVLGNPASVKRSLKPEEIENISKSAQSYITHSREYSK